MFALLHFCCWWCSTEYFAGLIFPQIVSAQLCVTFQLVLSCISGVWWTSHVVLTTLRAAVRGLFWDESELWSIFPEISVWNCWTLSFCLLLCWCKSWKLKKGRKKGRKQRSPEHGSEMTVVSKIQNCANTSEYFHGADCFDVIHQNTFMVWTVLM